MAAGPIAEAVRTVEMTDVRDFVLSLFVLSPDLVADLGPVPFAQLVKVVDATIHALDRLGLLVPDADERAKPI